MITSILLPSLVAALPATEPVVTADSLIAPSYSALMAAPLVATQTNDDTVGTNYEGTYDPNQPYQNNANYSSNTTYYDDDDDDNRWDDDFDFSYTFVEIGFFETDLDDFDEDDPESYYIDGSIALGMFQIVAGYQNTEIDFGDSSTDQFRLGIGAHFEVAPRLDIQGDISWLFADTSSDLGNLDDDNNGFIVTAGPRWLALPWSGGGLELAANLLYRDIEGVFASDDGQFGFELETRIHFLNLFSLGASYFDYDGDQNYAFNARVSF
ncbi:MAG: hypothetical protein AAF726_06810 [Planctomycetota bacterium]